MGFFGKKKTSSNPEVKDEPVLTDAEYQQYPVAMAISVSAPAPPGGPSAPSAMYDAPPPMQPPTVIPAALVTGSPLQPQQPQQQQVVKPVTYQQQQQYPQPDFITRRPMKMNYCPHCQHTNLKTYTKTKPTWKTWLVAGVLFVVFWPICWIPLVVDSLKQTDHYCPSCRAPVASVGVGQDCCVATTR